MDQMMTCRVLQAACHFGQRHVADLMSHNLCLTCVLLNSRHRTPHHAVLDQCNAFFAGCYHPPSVWALCTGDLL